MGRYWNTNRGDEGKFGFATQSSGDGEFFGLDYDEEEDECFFTMYGEDLNAAKKGLDVTFDALGVDEKDREYYVPLDGEGTAEKYYKYAFVEDKDGHFYNPETGMNESERFPNAYLWLCRARLGTAIYSTIKDEGFCSLECEA